MQDHPWLVGLAFFGGALVFSSFVEYWVHRFMHNRRIRVHCEHHQHNEGRGVLWEYWDYVKPAFPLMFPMFLVSLPAGIGWLIGANAYALFSAFGHQVQHDNPLKCFWMPMPIHYVHHHLNQWHHNFGLALDVWDRVFGTYKPQPDWREGLDPDLAKRPILAIRWW